jgi:hypothetical protein
MTHDNCDSCDIAAEHRAELEDRAKIVHPVEFQLSSRPAPDGRAGVDRLQGQRTCLTAWPLANGPLHQNKICLRCCLAAQIGSPKPGGLPNRRADKAVPYNMEEYRIRGPETEA